MWNLEERRGIMGKLQGEDFFFSLYHVGDQLKEVR
jgi:hypothetical protein